MITKFISANPVLAALIVITAIALIYYLVKRAKGGQTNSPNNFAPSNSSGSTTPFYSPTDRGSVEARLRELRIVNAPDASNLAVNSNPNAAKSADMGAKAARNVPAGVH